MDQEKKNIVVVILAVCILGAVSVGMNVVSEPNPIPADATGLSVLNAAGRGLNDMIQYQAIIDANAVVVEGIRTPLTPESRAAFESRVEKIGREVVRYIEHVIGETDEPVKISDVSVDPNQE